MTRPAVLRASTEITDRFLDECLNPTVPAGSGRSGPELPLVALLGPRGSGKSAVLVRIEERCRELVVPVARLDLEGREQASPGQVASALAFMLAHRLDGVPNPHFPRLLLGQLVLDAPLHLRDPARARRQIDELLRSRPERSREGEGMGLVGDLLEQVGWLPPGGALALGLAVEGLGGRLNLGRSPHRSALEWYGRDSTDPRDALATLNQYWNSGDPNEERSVDEAQCGAFLADLRAYRAKHRSRVCVAVLDNADSPAGAAFLDTLIRVREAWDVAGPGERDSLLVIAASRRRPRTWSRIAPGEDQVPPRAPDAAGYGDWTRSRRQLGSDGSWWYPVLLRGLSLGDLDAISSAETRRARAADPERAATLTDLTAAVHRATGGHPWAARALIGAILNRSQGTSRPDALRRALDTPVRLVGEGPGPGPDPLTATAGGGDFGGGPTLGEYALDSALRGVFEPGEAASLASLAAAWDPDDSAELDQWIPVPATGFPQLYQKLKDSLWLVEDASADPRARPSRGMVPFVPEPRRISDIHPWLRTLLLHRLARGEEGTGPTWTSVHTGLCQEYRREAAAAHDPGTRRGLSVRALHHALSVDAMPEVVAYLKERWEDRVTSPSAWLEEFNTITTAPNRLPRQAQPRGVLERLAAPAADLSESERLLWLLAGARWILCDPLADPVGELRPLVGDLLRSLGTRSRTGFQLFYDEADRYR
ncbi:hypothetical protein [Wenjunlia tyrosinilytica]|uniref:Uncharacterized protein n=1 Tax=Wenjunlia tyrosinilytica TaxID=1544741 RepID=A0A917ZTY7_9ACTN|nr:hypothetical protein [Wenjunlia tyrosinilytica]GGO93683.1 hypothetical protein GCM10012280_46760 [Wenjunlia tyrosinilytica]